MCHQNISLQKTNHFNFIKLLLRLTTLYVHLLLMIIETDCVVTCLSTSSCLLRDGNMQEFVYQVLKQWSQRKLCLSSSYHDDFVTYNIWKIVWMLRTLLADNFGQPYVGKSNWKIDIKRKPFLVYRQKFTFWFVHSTQGGQ